MQSQWHHFLTTQDITDTLELAEPELARVDLAELGVVAVSGADAPRFLQAQVSNDLRELTATHSQLNSHCSPKGRMLANFRSLITANDEFLLIAPRSQIELLLQRLRMFVLRAQVQIEDRSDDYACFGILGDQAAALGEYFTTVPQQTDDLSRHDNGSHIIRVAGTLPRWLFVGQPEWAQTLWTALAGSPVGADTWHLHDIRAGIPTIYPETRDLFVPQMANMQLIDGMSFHKGCYTGQEVVARMQYLGKLKRRMYYAHTTATPPPTPGAPLFAPHSRADKAAGQVVEAQRNAAGETELLAVVEIAAAEQGTVSLEENGAPLAFQAPSYGFASAQAA